MAYTLTQARPLLNAAELELFEQSRAEPVKRLTPAQLASAVKRTRTLRDKSRDLYQRQTVAVRTSTPGAVTGDDNERTQRKADILQEVLERYEARATLVQERGDSTIKSKTSSNDDSHRKATGGAARGKAGAAPSRSAAGADQGVKASVSKKAPRTGAAAKGAAAPAAPAAQAGAKTATSAGTAKASQSTSGAKKASVSAQLNTLAGVGASQAADGNAKKSSASQRKAGSAPARSAKAPSRKAPTANHKAKAPDVNAPLDTVPAAKRASPLKQKPGNIAIHAHQSSSGRRTQGKRDSR